VHICRETVAGRRLQQSVPTPAQQPAYRNRLISRQVGAGNLLNDEIKRLTCDAEGRIATSYSPTFGVTSSYIYDADGQRVSKIFGSYETDYVHDPGGALLATYVNGSYAMHTLEDLTSPMHTTDDGTPLVWYGKFGHFGTNGALHWMGENDPSNSWARFGQAIRVTLAAYVEANPVGAAKHDINGYNFVKEVGVSLLLLSCVLRIAILATPHFICKAERLSQPTGE
jgi:YD repeat-containing protein